ncbi:MAG: recombinase family protein [Hungatella sp.]
MEEVKIGAAYIRVSTDDQTELSPDAQLRQILEMAKIDGYVIPPEFIFMEERGRSGRRADNRPAFQRMITVAKSQPAPFDRLYLWKFSRFARNQEESTFYKGILRKKCGVEIKSVSEPIAEGMFGRLIEMIIEWFDEFYSVNLYGEVIRGMTEKALRNGYQTTPCLGYDSVGGGKPFVINEAQYKIVEYIHKSYHDGKDQAAIARELNSMGYRTRRGGLFEARSVLLILKNEFYTGTVKWKDIRFFGEHEVRESVTSIFEANQKRIRREYRPNKQRSVSTCAHWLSSLLKCSVCGASLGYNRNSSNPKAPYFQCWTYCKGVHEGSCSITVKKAENAILESMQQILATGKVDFSCERKITSETSMQKELLKLSLSRLDTKERRVRDAYEGGIDTLEEYKENKLRLQAERDELLKELEQIPRYSDNGSQEEHKTDLLKQIQNVYDLINNSGVNYEIKGNAVRSVLKKIEYDRKKDEFLFFYYV